MKKTLLVLLITLTLLLSGCSSKKDYSNELNTYNDITIISNDKYSSFAIDFVDSMTIDKNGTLEIIYYDDRLYLFNGDYTIIFSDKK